MRSLYAFSVRTLVLLLLAAVGRAEVAVTYREGVAPVAALSSYFTAFGRAVQSGDAASLPPVAANFTCATAALADAKKFFPEAVAQIGRGLERLTIESVVPRGDVTDVAVTWTFGGREVTRNFVFDAAGQVVSVDFIFDAKHAKFAAPRVTMPDRVELPFVLRRNLPFIEAEVDGQRGLFFFDTGASRITLNERFFAGSQVPGTIGVARGANGEHPTKRAHVTRLQLGEMVAEEFECALADMSTLQQGDQPALGLIGQEALKHFEVVFDYARRVVVLYTLDEQGRTRAPHEFGRASTIVRFEQEGHLPVIEATLGRQPIRLAIDSGAGGGTLDLAARQRLGDVVQPAGAVQLVGMGGAPRLVEFVTGDLRVAEEFDFPAMRFACNDYSHFRPAGVTWDGIIGYQLLSPRPSAINYVRRELKFW